MTNQGHLPSKLSRLLCDIEDGRILDRILPGGRFWDAYRDACVDYSVHGLDMPDSLAHYHIQTIEGIQAKWKQEGCELPSPPKF